MTICYIYVAVLVATALVADVECQLIGDLIPSVRLLWTSRDPTDGLPGISSTPIDASPGTSITTDSHYSHDEARNWTGLTNDYEDGHIFWTDRTFKAVWKGYFSTHGSTIRSGSSNSIQGIAADWMANTLYYCDATYDWIILIDYNADFFRPLIDTGLDKPHGVAVHPQQGYIFWTDWGRSPKIERATLAGENRVVLVNTGLYEPNGIAVDYATDKLFWVESDSSGSRLETCDLNGGYRTTISSIASTNGFYFDLAIYQNTVFISDWKHKKIRYINKNDGTETYSLDLPDEPYGLTVYGPGILPTGNTPSPCSSNPCEHLCVSSTNTNGYQCLCEGRHHVLQADGRTCISDRSLAIGRVYFVTAESICSTFGNFLELTDFNSTCILENRDFAVSLTTDVRAKLMFFSDVQRKRIFWARLYDQEALQTLTGGTESVEGLAVDWLTQNLYWTDSIRQHIVVSRYDGSRRHILIADEVITPRSLVIHAGQRLMFWSERVDQNGNAGQIEKAGLDGSNRQVIVTNVQTSGLAIDFDLERLYFADRVTSSIFYVDFNGNGRTTVYTRQGAEYFDVAIHKDYLLWTERGQNNPDNRGLRALHLETGEFVKHIPTDTDMFDINVYDLPRQPDGVAVCGQNNGGCDHLCLPRLNGGFVCACATGYTLSQVDGKSCETDVKTDNFMLMTDSYLRTIFQVDLSNPPELSYTALPIEGLENPFAFTYDPYSRKVYWSDLTSVTINRAGLDGSGRETLLGPWNGIRTPEGLALEPISGLLFWTDLDRDSISVCKLDGSNKKTVISTSLDRPRGIVLDHINGIMFWSDWGSTPKIERAHLDGTNRQIVLNTDLAAPNGLALDLATNKLFFCDPFRRIVESVNVDGTNRLPLLQLPQGFLPIGITLFQGLMFIADWSIHNLITAEQNGDNAATVGPDDFGRINFVHAHSSASIIEGTNSCEQNNGGCSHLCLPMPTGRTCACSDGATLQSNNLMCNPPTSAFLCPELFQNGRVGPECDRTSASSCVPLCDVGYETSVGSLTCGVLSNWNIAGSSICKAINPCADIPCLNGGTCTNLVSDYACACVSGWEGLTCNINVYECGSSPCLNGGTCHDGVDSYTCECPEEVGITGINCENSGSSNPCIANPCVNSGNCVSIGGSSFTCNCLPGYVGTRCEQDINECASNPCLNSVACTDLVNGYVCSCQDGYSGTQCEININECSSNPCQNSDSCLDLVNGFMCFCRQGYTGTRCQININECASNPCLNLGLCTDLVNVFVCTCQLGYSGTRCEINSNRCSSNPCLNSGTCTDLANMYVCSCQDGFTGTRCETIVLLACASNPCVNSGICTNQDDSYVCSCLSGFSGLRCEINDPDCEPNPCRNGGACTDLTDSFQCTCLDGWTGSLCEIDINACSSNPCLNSGLCIDQLNGYSCSCQSGYSGIRCENRVTCPSIQLPANGRVNPPSCLTSSNYGDVCAFICNEGDFVLIGPQFRTCITDGTWSRPEDVTSCIFTDITPPVFITTCPNEITVTASEPCLTQTIVTFDPPMVSDNSGQVTLTPSTTSELLEIGRYERTYTAEDTAGNIAQCRLIINVKGIECGPPPQTSQFGFISSSSCLEAFGSKVTYQCFPGYILTGSAEVQCGISGEWLGSAPICQEIKCDSLALPIRGDISPRSCFDADSVPAGTQCSIWCEENYELTGADSSVTCIDGSWTDDLTNAVCQDVSAPTIVNCPNSFDVILPPSSATVSVTWPVPTATSKGEDITPVQTNGYTPPVDLEPGVYQMEYIATDEEDGPESYCRFTIQVEDTEAPEVVSCLNEPITRMSTSFPFALQWDEPEFTDNVEVVETLRTGEPGMVVYTWGSVSVRYTAFDAADNMAECIVIIDVIQSSSCHPLVPPVNGGLECDESIGEGAMCRAYCDEGYGFLDRYQPNGPYTCLPTGVWSHATAMNPRPQTPACVEISNDNRLSWTREDVVILGGEQCTSDIQDPVQAAFLQILDNSGWMTSCNSDPNNSCMVGNVNVDCEAYPGSRRRKRQVTGFMVKYQLIGQRSDSTNTDALEESMGISATDLVPDTGITISVQGQNVVLDVLAVATGSIEASCDPGQDLIGVICVSCPVGTSYDLVETGCRPCDVGTYQDQVGQLICKACPDGTTTDSLGSYDVDQCSSSCESGYYSYLGVQPCEPCPRGSFQADTGQRGCLPCDEGDTTISEGAISDELCVAIGSFTYPPTTIIPDKITEASGDSDSLPLTPIIIGVVAVLVLILIIGIAAKYTCRRRGSAYV